MPVLVSPEMDRRVKPVTPAGEGLAGQVVDLGLLGKDGFGLGRAGLGLGGEPTLFELPQGPRTEIIAGALALDEQRHQGGAKGVGRGRVAPGKPEEEIQQHGVAALGNPAEVFKKGSPGFSVLK